MSALLYDFGAFPVGEASAALHDFGVGLLVGGAAAIVVAVGILLASFIDWTGSGSH